MNTRYDWDHYRYQFISNVHYLNRKQTELTFFHLLKVIAGKYVVWNNLKLFFI